MIPRLTGREGDRAVAHQGGGYTMARSRCQQRVPAYLGIEMGMQVDKTWRYSSTLGIDFLSGTAINFADLSNGVTADAHISRVGFAARAVYNQSVPDYHVISHV